MVRRLRRHHDWSIRELAERAEVSPTQLSRIERLAASPTEDTIVRLAGALGVAVSQLFAEDVAVDASRSIAIPVHFTDGVRQVLAEAGVPVERWPEAERLVLATTRAICASLGASEHDGAPRAG